MKPQNELARMPRTRLWRAQARTAITLSLLFMVVYGGCNWITTQRGDVGTLVFAWERNIPFVPLMILPYMSIDLFFVLAPFLCRSRAELAVYTRRVRLAILVAGVFFLILPLRLTFTTPAVTGWLGAIFNFLHGFDQPHNLFPSLHIALRTILADKYARHTKGLTRWMVHLWFSLIGFSTVLTWQHHVLDILGGFILAAFCFYLYQDHPLGSPAAKNTRVGRLYGAGALGLLALALITWPWGALALWPAGALALASAAYFGHLPDLYRKQNGRLPLSTKWILAPLRLGQSISLRYYQRQCRPWDEVCPGVWLGRQLTGAESRRARRQGVRAVLDLTAEFSETPAFLDAVYLNVPILDLTAPTSAQLEAGARFIGEQVVRGRVYVHCKIGYSRSAIMVGAYLVQAGHARTVREAIDRIREKRPSVILRKEALEALERFQASRSASALQVR